MVHAWIVFELTNGVQIKYVRDIVVDTAGLNKEYYGYTGEVGVDGFAEQVGTPGLIKADYIELLSLYGTVDKIQSFPEDSGDTAILIRHNKAHGIGDNVNVYTSVIKVAIARIYIVEQWVPTGRELTSETLPILPLI